jgi:hypothetical protein
LGDCFGLHQNKAVDPPKNSTFMQWIKSIILAVFLKGLGLSCPASIGIQKVIYCLKYSWVF